VWTRLASWRFWVLVGLAVLDAALFFVPAVAVGLVIAALIDPGLLRRAARFLDALADGA